MRRRKSQATIPTRLESNELAIARAWQRLYDSPLSALARVVTYLPCDGESGDPELGCVEPVTGRLWLNPHVPRHVGEDQWAAHIGHLLLHLGLNHAYRREDREPLIWNVACEDACDRLLPLFGLRSDFAASPGEQQSEEAAFEALSETILLKSAKRPELRTLAGKGRPDIVGLGRLQTYRRDYEDLLAEGIREAVETTVARVAANLGDEVTTGWGPAERARRWVMNEFPLLGALSTQIRIIADADLCRRLDISVAAVDGYLGEMYFNPEWRLSPDEWIFIYVHELLHVALLHHSRLRGRDPWTWNIACDYVINGWLVEMGVGRLPSIGALFDQRLQGMSADEVYDLLSSDAKRCKNLRGFRGKLGDILLERPGCVIRKNDVTTLDDLYRRCLSAGLSCPRRGMVAAGLLEEIRSLFTPPVPWDVELGRWMEAHVPFIREPLRTYARANRRQSAAPEIPRPGRHIPEEWREACTFGVVLDTSGSMDRSLLGRALGAIASYSEAREVPRVRLVLCDATPYDQGWVSPTDLRGVYPVKGRGGTVLQPAVTHLISRPDLPRQAPVMIITDGWCEASIECPREHCFVMPRKSEGASGGSLRTPAPVFRVLKVEQ